MKLNLDGHACFITHTLLARRTFIFPCSFVSGILIIASDLEMNIPTSESGAVTFFCRKAFGIILGDVVQVIYTRVCGEREGWSERVLGKRLVGYVWVVAFMCW